MSKKPWLSHYDRGVPASLAYPDCTLFDLLDRSAEKFPQRACTIYNGETISYRQMKDITDQLAAALHRLGLQKGERVGLLLPNSPLFVIVYYGLMKAGAVVVAINPQYTPPEIVYQLNDAGAEFMLLMADKYEMVTAIQAQTIIRQLIVADPQQAIIASGQRLAEQQQHSHTLFRLQPDALWLHDLVSGGSPSQRPELQITPDDIALFQYSGGTTGVSKGVVATHRAVVANVYQFDAWIVNSIEGQEVMGLAIPLYHVYGMVLGLNLGVKMAASLVIVPDPRHVIDVVEKLEKYRVTLFPGVPAMYNAINLQPQVQAGKYDLSCIKACISGSAPLMRETKQQFERITGGRLVEGYGLSEASTASHCNPLLGENRSGSIGLPLPDVDCRILDLQDEQTDLPPGEMGELVLRGPMVMKGYHNKKQETAIALRDGWLFTGDIAYMDQDGYFYIVDRKKDVIKPGGLQAWPRQIEEVLSAHPQVLEAGVAGIPDAIQGEAVKAWVVLKPGQALSESELQQWCRHSLAPYKVPKEVEFIDRLPRNSVGKLLRRELGRREAGGS